MTGAKRKQTTELSADKQALVALRRMRAKLEAYERARNEPIAIVGLGCRFPGGASGPDFFWRVLRDGVDAITEVPKDRWDVEALYDADPDAPGKISCRYGGFIGDVRGFDAEFFGIAPVEARALDPQQRLALEVSWEALENAGIAADRLGGAAGGVFIGVSTNDYTHEEIAAGEPVDAYFGTGAALASLAGRVSYVLGLTGPSLVVDTACSSSLVSLHLACQSLRSDECTFALAGGVNVILTPEVSAAFSRARMMAADGRCKTFDAAADGYVRGEGCGVLVLERLSTAVEAGHRVLALIRGSAVNQDGRSSGLTVPNERAQEAVIRSALRAAGVAPADIDYVEVHGTGTKLGDPIELQALGAALSEGRPAERPVTVGSVKTNVGHLEAAAGVAGVIKVVLALQNETIPRHLHFREPNPFVPWNSLPVVVAAEPRPWRRDAGAGSPRLAGVSSFGFTGTNAHVVLEEAPASRRREPLETSSELLLLSARSDAALQELARSFAEHLRKRPEELSDVCFTARVGRAHFGERAALVARSAEEMSQSLEQLVASGEAPRARRGTARTGRPRLAFLFSGQGSQYAGMGRELYDAEPGFRSVIDRCDALSRGELDPSLLSVLYGAEAERIGETRFTQPALFAVELALFELYRSWGIVPSIVIGHSVGEIAAATAAGVLELEEAFRLVLARGRLMQERTAKGSMVAVFASEARVRSAIEKDGAAVAVAAVNAPEQVVLSGSEEGMRVVRARLEANGLDYRELEVSRAFHSPLMDPMLDAFRDVASGLSYRSPGVTLVSNVTGRVAGKEVEDPAYWVRHVREPVRFAEGICSVLERGCDALVEIGPGASLLGMARTQADGPAPAMLASLRRERSARDTILDAVAGLYVRGARLDGARFDESRGPRERVALPTYPFQRIPFWFEKRARGERARSVPSVELVTPVGDTRDWTYEVAWEGVSRPAPERTVPVRTFVLSPDDGNFPRSIAAVARGEGHALEVVDSVTALCSRLSGSANAAAPTDVIYAPVPRSASEAFRACDDIRRLLSETATPMRLWLVTERAQAVLPDDPVDGLFAAPLWGLGRVLALEEPERFGALIDLDSRDGVAAELLVRELASRGRGDGHDEGDEQLALRDGKRYAARLARVTLETPFPRVSLDAEASYWITGGLGRLGLHVAKAFVERGARRLVLIGRHGLSPSAKVAPGSEEERRARAVSELESMGAHIQILVADVSDHERLEAEARRCELSKHPLRGVVHCAAVLDATPLKRMDPERLERMLAPKLSGGMALHRVTESREIDFLLLFSSTAAILGASGLGHYAAGNHFLDALAQHRRGLGLPATSVSWGTWDEMRWASAEERARFREGGLHPMPRRQALSFLDHVLQTDRSHLMVASVDWSTLKPIYEARKKRPFLSRFSTEKADRGAVPPRAALLARIESTSGREREALVKRYVENEVATTLGMDASRRLDPARRLSELGLDSLMAVKLKNRLETDLGLDVAIGNLLADATVETLGSAASLPRAVAEASMERRGEASEVLSFAQERFWFLDRLDPGSSLYNNPAVFRLRGALDTGALQSGLDVIRERHEILRTRFTEAEGAPRQVIDPPAPFPLEMVDLKALDPETREGELEPRVRAAMKRSFDLERGPLVHATLLVLAPDDHLLVLNMHHAVSDGWSYRVLLEELGISYRASLQGVPASLPALPVQYADFARWQRDQARDEAMERQLLYWKEKLRGSPPLLDLPLDFPRPPIQTFRGEQVATTLEPELRKRLFEIGTSSGATLFMTLLAAFNLLLYRFTGETDIPIGAPVFGRHRPDIENAIGIFLNHVVLRNDLTGAPTFRELLSRVRQVALEAYANQDLPFERLLSELAPARDLSKTPLFQVFFNMANLPDYRGAIEGVDVEYLFSAVAESKFDLTLYATEDEASVYHLVLVYNADLFERETAEQLVRGLKQLLRSVSESPDARLSRLALLPETHVSRTAAPPPSLRAGGAFVAFEPHQIEESPASRFRRIAASRSETVAVSLGRESVTYRELDRRSDAGMLALRRESAASDGPVALLFDHDVSMIVGLLSAVKAGRAYVPCDPSYPEERLAYVLRDSGARTLLTTEANFALAQELSKGTVAVIALEHLPQVGPTAGPEGDEVPGALAYVLYTSGSTGVPKGVMQSYRNLMHHVRSYTNNLKIGADDRISLVASYGFDASVMDIYGALLNGATLCPYAIRERGVEGLAAFLDEERITLFHATPTVFRHFLRVERSGSHSRHPDVRAVVLGGEEVTRTDVEGFRAVFSPEAVLVNGFGPTESTLALQWFIDRDTPVVRARVPVGFPVEGTEAVLLGDDGEPGQVLGEIGIESPWVALGYLGQEPLTRQAFVEGSNGSGARLYRTGDRGRLLPNGAIEFVGRRDARVKIRGFRVELEEIETQLGTHPLVLETAVAERSGTLVAYVVRRARGDEGVTAGELTTHLAERVPSFMLPGKFHFIDRLPLTLTGKVDRRALPEVGVEPGADETYLPPATTTEIALAEIWKRVLDVQAVGSRHNFFELGGHSLLATRLASEVQSELGVALPLRNLFRTPTLSSMAAWIDGERERGGDRDRARDAGSITRLSREAHRVRVDSRASVAVAASLRRRGGNEGGSDE